MSETLYKLTRSDRTTYNGTLWGEGVTHTTDGRGDLCGPGWIHAYTSPHLAVLLNPNHAGFSPYLLWEAEGVVGKTDHGLKLGCTSLTTLRIIDAPKWSNETQVRFAILCAMQVTRDPSWIDWAIGWLNNADRSKAAAAWVAGAGAWAAEAAGAAGAWVGAWAWAGAGAWVAGAAEVATKTHSIDLDRIAAYAFDGTLTS